MNERLRLNYLDAMGIVQYAARFPLLGALPSPEIEQDDVFDDAIETSTAPANSAQQLRQLLDAETSRPQSQTTPSHHVASQKITAPTQSIDNSVFRCQIALWQADDLLVLAETARMDNTQLTLLRNILKAIGRATQLANASQFSWPLPQHKDKSLTAARDHFQGMLDGGALHNSTVRQILCLGNSITSLLHSDSESSSTQQYRDWPVITVCALHEMLEKPNKKADTWRTLQVLVRT
ncbi:MAG TPA: hypothetical protein PKZ68_01235 [Pseudomonadales bacterium]|nr:hypothetical protein [Pseudomonadales bacterium]HNL92076.1 hypothetical protein [Pseudomonadales bacterium]